MRICNKVRQAGYELRERHIKAKKLDMFGKWWESVLKKVVKVNVNRSKLIALW